MNERNYNDFKIPTVRPEPVEGPFSISQEAQSIRISQHLQEKQHANES